MAKKEILKYRHSVGISERFRTENSTYVLKYFKKVQAYRFMDLYCILVSEAVARATFSGYVPFHAVRIKRYFGH